MHSELTHGGDKAHRSHHVPGWDRPSRGPGGGSSPSGSAPPQPRLPPMALEATLTSCRRPGGLLLQGWGRAAGTGAGHVSPPSLGPQKGLQLTSPATGSSPPSILSALQSKRLTFMGGGQAMEASSQPAGEAGGSGKGRVPTAPAPVRPPQPLAPMPPSQERPDGEAVPAP